MYNIFTIPLRDRAEDIPLLIKNIVLEYNDIYNTNKDIEEEAFLEMTRYIWPGNTKQLKKFIFRCLKIYNYNIINKKQIHLELNNEFTYEEKNYFDNFWCQKIWKSNS